MQVDAPPLTVAPLPTHVILIVFAVQSASKSVEPLAVPSVVSSHSGLVSSFAILLGTRDGVDSTHKPVLSS